MESEHSEDGKGGGEKLDRLVLKESAERGELSRGQEIGKGYTAYPIGPSEILLSTGEVEEAGELVLKSERPESPRGEEGTSWKSDLHARRQPFVHLLVSIELDLQLRDTRSMPLVSEKRARWKVASVRFSVAEVESLLALADEEDGNRFERGLGKDHALMGAQVVSGGAESIGEGYDPQVAKAGEGSLEEAGRRHGSGEDDVDDWSEDRIGVKEGEEGFHEVGGDEGSTSGEFGDGEGMGTSRTRGERVQLDP